MKKELKPPFWVCRGLCENKHTLHRRHVHIQRMLYQDPVENIFLIDKNAQSSMCTKKNVLSTFKQQRYY